MKNHWGQEISIGSTVGVGFRRTGAKWHQLGVVVKTEEKPINSWSRPEWVALVIWVSEDRGQKDWYDGPIFHSQYPARDLLVIDDESIDEDLLGHLEAAYADWVFRHAPVPFTAPAR